MSVEVSAEEALCAFSPPANASCFFPSFSTGFYFDRDSYRYLDYRFAGGDSVSVVYYGPRESPTIDVRQQSQANWVSGGTVPNMSKDRRFHLDRRGTASINDRAPSVASSNP
ncbi:hypothetical protein IAD21_04882 [Abditibacteriota bacterium]|nr:hypothetical protein IAD21_04882 [Abditibacteriota bacterium]